MINNDTTSLKSIHPPMLKEKQIGFNFYIAHFCDNCVCSTILVEPHCTAYITKSGDIRIEVIVLYLLIFCTLNTIFSWMKLPLKIIFFTYSVFMLFKLIGSCFLDRKKQR